LQNKVVLRPLFISNNRIDVELKLCCGASIHQRRTGRAWANCSTPPAEIRVVSAHRGKPQRTSKITQAWQRTGGQYDG